jgi:hypothetical protein
MINLKNRYYITIAVRAKDGDKRPKVGEVVQSNGFLFAVRSSSAKWVTLTAVIKNKVEYIECLASFKQDEPILVEDWYPTDRNPDVYNKYIGETVFVGNYETTSFPL